VPWQGTATTVRLADSGSGLGAGTLLDCVGNPKTAPARHADPDVSRVPGEIVVQQDGLNRVLPSAAPSPPPGHLRRRLHRQTGRAAKDLLLLAIRDEQAATDGGFRP